MFFMGVQSATSSNKPPAAYKLGLKHIDSTLKALFLSGLMNNAHNSVLAGSPPFSHFVDSFIHKYGRRYHDLGPHSFIIGS